MTRSRRGWGSFLDYLDLKHRPSMCGTIGHRLSGTLPLLPCPRLYCRRLNPWANHPLQLHIPGIDNQRPRRPKMIRCLTSAVLSARTRRISRCRRLLKIDYDLAR